VTDAEGVRVRRPPRRTRDEIMAGLPPLGTLRQTSARHLDLLYALAYPAKGAVGEAAEDQQGPVTGLGAAMGAALSGVPAPAVPAAVPMLQPGGLGRRREDPGPTTLMTSPTMITVAEADADAPTAAETEVPGDAGARRLAELGVAPPPDAATQLDGPLARMNLGEGDSLDVEPDDRSGEEVDGEARRAADFGVVPRSGL